MKEADFQYLRNINTSPGPNAGRSIDPTKPGPDAERIAELEREISELEAANEATPTWGAAVGARWEIIKGLRAELSRLRNEQPTHHPDGRRVGRSRLVYDKGKRTIVPEPAPSPRPQDVREEPVAWQYQFGDNEWALCESESHAVRLKKYNYEIRPLYAAPPRPDASGLIEAAEWLEQRAIWHETKAGHTIGEQSKHHKSAAREDSQAAKLLRARADRSEK